MNLLRRTSHVLTFILSLLCNFQVNKIDIDVFVFDAAKVLSLRQGK